MKKNLNKLVKKLYTTSMKSAVQKLVEKYEMKKLQWELSRLPVPTRSSRRSLND